MALDEGATGLFRGFSARHDFSTEWHRFLYPTGTAPNRFAVSLDAERFPTFVRNRMIRIDRMTAFVRLKEGLTYDENDPLTLTIQPPTGASKVVELQVATEAGGLPAGKVDYGAGVTLSPTMPWRVDITDLPAALRTTVEVERPID